MSPINFTESTLEESPRTQDFVTSSTKLDDAYTLTTVTTVVSYSIGMLVNALLLVYIIKVKVCGPLSIALFRWQTFVDMLVCLAGLFYRLQHFTEDENDHLPITNVIGFVDYFICKILYTGMVIWALFLMSVFNLCALAAERYISVCWPFVYRDLRMRHIVAAILICTTWAFVISTSWCLDEGRHPLGTLIIKDGVCQVSFFSEEYRISRQKKYNFKLFFEVAYWVWFLNSFFFPFIAMTLFYSAIVRKLRDKKNVSATFDSAATGFTVLMAFASAVFVTTQAYPNTLWLVEGAFHVDIGLGNYFFHGNVANVMVYMLTCLNSMANPFIYFGYYAFKKLKSKGFCGGLGEFETNVKSTSMSMSMSKTNLED